MINLFIRQKNRKKLGKEEEKEWGEREKKKK